MAPALESLLLQVLPIFLIERFISHNLCIQTVASALIFGSTYYYDALYIIFESCLRWLIS